MDEYFTVFWRIVEDILLLEKIQRRATKYILGDYYSDYTTRLSRLKLLPLMRTFELNDLLFFIKNYQHPQACFDIKTWFDFTLTQTRSSSFHKLSLNQHNTSFHHPFLDKFPRLYNALPYLDLSLPFNSLKQFITEQFWHKFHLHFNPDNPCTFHFVCPCRSCSSSPIPTNFTR